MRLGLFGFVLFGLLASSWAASYASRGILATRTQTRNPNREPPPPPPRIRITYERHGNNNPGSCSRVTKRQIQSLNTVLNEALNRMTRPHLQLEMEQVLDSEKVPSSSSSRSRQPRANIPNNMNSNNRTVSSQNDQCQQLLFEMKGATEEITKLVDLLHDHTKAVHPRQYDVVEIGRLKTALETQMRQLDSASINLETGLSRNQNRDMRAALREMEENVVYVEIAVDVFKSRAEKQKAGIQNYELLILQIRQGNMTGANLCYEKLEDGFWDGDDEFEDDENDDEAEDEKYYRPFLKWIVQDAYDGQSLNFFRHTLSFAHQLPDLGRDEETYPALFEKVNASSAHRSDPRVLLPLSFCIRQSMQMHKQENYSASAVFMETSREMFYLLVKEILEPWAIDIRQGNISSILQFQRRGSELELELEGFRIYLRVLVQKAYDRAQSHFERTLDFVKALQTHLLRAMGLEQIFEDLRYRRDHGTRLAFQVKKLLDSLGLETKTEAKTQGVEDEDDEDDEAFALRLMTKVKADLPQWERLAVWGGGTCHIQNNYYDEYLDAFGDIPLEVTDENKKRRIFTRTRQDKDVKAEWTFHASQQDQGHTFKIQNLAHKGEWLFAHGPGGNNEKDNEGFLGSAKGPWSHLQTSKWIVERVKRGRSWFFTIKNQGNGQYLSAGNEKPGQDPFSSPYPNRRRRPVITISENSTSSDKHLWRLRCDRV